MSHAYPIGYRDDEEKRWIQNGGITFTTDEKIGTRLSVKLPAA
jgi:hypothetical protein